MTSVLMIQSPTFRAGTEAGKKAADALDFLGNTLSHCHVQTPEDLDFSPQDFDLTELVSELSAYLEEIDAIVIAAPVPELLRLNGILAGTATLFLTDGYPSEQDAAKLGKQGKLALPFGWGYETHHAMLLKMAPILDNGDLEYQGIVLDMGRNTVQNKETGARERLTATEMKMLRFIMAARTNTVSLDNLIRVTASNNLHDDERSAPSNNVQVYKVRINKKMALIGFPEALKTERGVGIYFDPLNQSRRKAEPTASFQNAAALPCVVAGQYLFDPNTRCFRDQSSGKEAIIPRGWKSDLLTALLRADSRKMECRELLNEIGRSDFEPRTVNMQISGLRQVLEKAGMLAVIYSGKTSGYSIPLNSAFQPANDATAVAGETSASFNISAIEEYLEPHHATILRVLAEGQGQEISPVDMIDSVKPAMGIKTMQPSTLSTIFDIMRDQVRTIDPALASRLEQTDRGYRLRAA